MSLMPCMMAVQNRSPYLLCIALLLLQDPFFARSHIHAIEKALGAAGERADSHTQMPQQCKIVWPLKVSCIALVCIAPKRLTFKTQWWHDGDNKYHLESIPNGNQTKKKKTCIDERAKPKCNQCPLFNNELTCLVGGWSHLFTNSISFLGTVQKVQLNVTNCYHDLNKWEPLQTFVSPLHYILLKVSQIRKKNKI